MKPKIALRKSAKKARNKLKQTKKPSEVKSTRLTIYKQGKKTRKTKIKSFLNAMLN